MGLAKRLALHVEHSGAVAFHDYGVGIACGFHVVGVQLLPVQGELK